MSGKYGDLIKNARITDLQHAVQPETPLAEAVEHPPDDPFVSLTIRVRKSQRAHWSAEAKRKSGTITDAIIQALNSRFGEPN